MVQKKKTTTSKPKTTAKPAPRPSAQSVGQSFDVIPANKVVPSPSGRPVITSTTPIPVDNTLTKQPSVILKKSLAKKAIISPSLATKHTMIAATHDISSGGDVLLEDIAASLNTLQPVADNSRSTHITVKTSRSLAGPTVAELLSAQAKPAHSTAPVSKPVSAAARTVAGEKTVMPPSSSSHEDAPRTTEPKVAAKDMTVEKPAATEPHGRGNAPDAQKANTQENNTQAIKPDDKLDDVLGDIGMHEVNSSNGQVDPAGVPENNQVKKPATAQLYGGSSVLIIHEAHPLRTVLKYVFWFVLILVVALVVLNFLLDAGVVSTGYDIPYTDVLDP